MTLEDKQAITEVLFRYARAVDRGDFDTVLDCYFEDANDNHGGYNGHIQGLVDDMKIRHQTIESSIHHVTNVLIDLDGDTAQAEAYCLCFIRRAPEADGTQVVTTVKCRYVDRFEKRLGTWKIADRIVVFEELANSTITNEQDSTWVAARRSQDDPVYTRRP